MARGFESKSVQSQWQDAEVERAARKRKKPEDRETMEAALRRHLDAELKRIGDSG